jgi:hypothetical protein
MGQNPRRTLSTQRRVHVPTNWGCSEGKSGWGEVQLNIRKLFLCFVHSVYCLSHVPYVGLSQHENLRKQQSRSTIWVFKTVAIDLSSSGHSSLTRSQVKQQPYVEMFFFLSLLCFTPDTAASHADNVKDRLLNLYMVQRAFTIMASSSESGPSVFSGRWCRSGREQGPGL